MGFPVPIEYALNDRKDNTIVKYNNGAEWEGLPSPAESGGITPTGTKQISITENGTVTEDVTNYANAEITVNVSGDVSSYLGVLARTATSFSSAEVTSLGKNALNGATTINTINLPNLKSITGDYCIANTGITSLYLPNLETTVSNGIRNNNSLLYLILPKCKSTAWHLFRDNNALIAVDLRDIPSLSQDTFNGNTAMNTVILRKTNKITSLIGINAFTNTPFASGKAGGTLYVPSALIDTYQSAENWSVILGYANNQILPIEGSIYETQYADGTPIS